MSSHPEVLNPVGVGSAKRAIVAAGWRRFVVPSLSDFVFIFLIVWLFIATKPGWNVLLDDGDTGWHIRVGESILATGTVPMTDPFSFSKPGAPWYAWEWLSEVAMAGLHGWGGLKAVTLAAGVMIALFGVLLLRYMLWRGANTLIALLVTLLVFGAASVHFLARPHLFTMVLLVIALWMLEADHRKPSWRVWLLVPLTVLWTNLHGGFLVLFVALGGLVVGRLLEGWVDPELRSSRWREARRYSVLGVLCAVSSVVNPYGIELHRHILAYLRSDWIKQVVAEFQSPSFRAENVLQYEIVLLVGLMAAGWLLSRKKLVEALWILVWAHFSLSSARHIPIFIIFAGPLVALELTRLWEDWSEHAGPKTVVGILDRLSRDLNSGFGRTSLWPLAFVVFLALSGPWLKWPTDFPNLGIPVAMIHRNEDRIRGARVLADDEYGDYLIYAYYPEQRVFVDGRSDFYGPEIGGKYLALLYGEPKWKSILAEYDFDLVLIPAKRPLASLLRQSPDWALVDSNDKAVLFAPRR